MTPMVTRTTAPPLRVGLIVPINNTTMERELLGWLPAGSTCRTLRIPRGKGMLTREVVPAYQDASLALARGFPPSLDIIAYGCTAAGFLAGPQADAALATRIAAATGTPVVTTARAMVAELLAASVRVVDLVTPYSDAVNQGLAAFLAAADIAVGRIERLAAPDVDALGRLTAADVAAAAGCLISSASDAIFIACSQLPTATVLSPLREACGKPVLSSIQATAAQVMLAVRQRSRPVLQTAAEARA
jgi:maleate cis-trans isomerase